MLFGRSKDVPTVQEFMDELGIKYLKRDEKVWILSWRIDDEIFQIHLAQTEETVLLVAPMCPVEGEPSDELARDLLARNGRYHLGRYAVVEELGVVFQVDAPLEGLTSAQFSFMVSVVVKELKEHAKEIRELCHRGSPPRLFK